MQKTKKLKKQRKHKGKGGTRKSGETNRRYNPIHRVLQDPLLFKHITEYNMVPGRIYKHPDINIEYKFITEYVDNVHGLSYDFEVNSGKDNQYGITLHHLTQEFISKFELADGPRK